MNWEIPFSYKKSGIFKKKFVVTFNDSDMGEVGLSEVDMPGLIDMLNAAFNLGKVRENNNGNMSKRLIKAIEVLQRIKDRYPYIWSECIANGEIDAINGK